jgi:hypothetical protein
MVSLDSRIFGPASLGKDQALIVGGTTKQAGFFKRVGSLRAGRQRARCLQGIHRVRVLASAVGGGFLLHGNIPILRFTRIC